MSQNNEIIIGVAVVIILLLIVGTFILMMVIYFNQRKKKFIDEKKTLQQQYNEQLLQSQLEMQEQTFNTISIEIHDNVGQILSLAKVQLNIIDQSETLDRSILSDAKESVSKAMTDLRDIAKSLNSERIQLSSLPEITEHELSRISRAKLMNTSLKTEGNIVNMQEQKKLIIFRIIQEALNNIIKHSKANNVDICFCYENENLKITIADNGTGFDKEMLQQKDGLGLKNIYSRAALIGGEANINSIPNEGTVITIISPYA